MLTFTPRRLRPKAALLITTSAVLTDGSLSVQSVWQPPRTATLLPVLLRAINSDSQQPLDIALSAYARMPSTSHRPMRALSFNHIDCYSGNVWHHGKEYYTAVKGIPEDILALCDLTENEYEQALGQLRKMSAAGEQVVALADSITARPIESLKDLTVRQRLRLIGLIGLKPVIAPAARQQIEKLHKKGHDIYFATGKHKIAAHATASQAGIVAHANKVYDARRLRLLPKAHRHDILQEVRVFSRANPAYKDHIAQLLVQDGRVIIKITTPQELYSISVK